MLAAVALALLGTAPPQQSFEYRAAHLPRRRPRRRQRAYVALALPPLEFAADSTGERLGDDGALLVDDSRAASPNDDDWPADEASNGQP